MKRKCVVCGGVPKKVFVVNGKEVVRCGGCELGWVEDFVEPDYQKYHRDETYDLEEELFRNIFLKIYKFVSGYVGEEGRVLEIGSSNGLLLSLFKEQGWKVTGIEPSKQAGRLAKKRGIRTMRGNFESQKIPKECYDLVLMNHVLEHVGDPVLFLKKVKRILKPGGKLFVAVPNFGSLQAELLKARWTPLLPGEHRWQFSFESLSRLGSKVGLNTLVAKTNSGLWGMSDPIGEMGRSLVGMKKRFFGYLFGLPMDTISVLTGRGQNLMVMFEKKK